MKLRNKKTGEINDYFMSIKICDSSIAPIDEVYSIAELCGEEEE